MTRRDPELTSQVLGLAAEGRSTSQIEEATGCNPRRIRRILERAGVSRPAGRPPADPAASPPTHHTARGRALLSTLVEDATSVGVEPEVYLDDARAMRAGST